MSKPKLDEESMLAEMGPVAAFARRVKPTVEPTAEVAKAQTRGQPKPIKAEAPEADEAVLETIRATVRQVGRETASYRFADQEKLALAEMISAYRRKGIRTSENELVRIGLNWLLADYKRRGQASVLAQVLIRLNQ
jgi:hypothetical protein